MLALLQPVAAAGHPGPLQAGNFAATSTTGMNHQQDIISQSQAFLYAARTGEEVTAYVNAFATLPFETLVEELSDDDKKKAFWLNLYNGYTQYLLRHDSSLYRNRNRFFSARQLTIAGKQFSLDDMEHGILRRSKVKWAFGYLSKPFPSKTEKKLRVQRLDHRIHFALNCGAKSCPPIAYYKPADIDKQLQLAQKVYLKNQVQLAGDENIVYLPKILQWFKADFGGAKGIKDMLQQAGFTQVNNSTKLRYNKYDWTLQLDNN